MENLNGDSMNNSILQPVRMKLKIEEVPRYFDRTGLCSMDIVAYVRKKDRCPDPRVPVVLESDCSPFDKEYLSGNKIFWSGIEGNEDKISIFSGLSDNVCLPIYPDEFDAGLEDYGLIAKATEMGAQYELHDYTVLLCGDSSNKELCDAWSYVSHALVHGFRFSTTLAVATKSHKLVNGLDIAPYVNRIRERRSVNELTHNTLMEIMGEIGEEIKEMQMKGLRPVIQYLEHENTQDVYLMFLYLSLKHNLSPTYVEQYLQNYVEYRFNYDYRRMSLYERFMWVRNLPDEFGYLGADVKLHCFCTLSDSTMFKLEPSKSKELTIVSENGTRLSAESAKRCYPSPLYAVYLNLDNHKEIVFKPSAVSDMMNDENLSDEEYNLLLNILPHTNKFKYLNYADVSDFVDFRNSFPGSQKPFSDDFDKDTFSKKLVTSDSDVVKDYRNDQEWRRVFVAMAEQVKERYNDVIYPTVKNCILYQMSSRELLLLYCPGCLGVTCKLSSEYFNKDIQILDESVFHRFIDMRTLLALIEKKPTQGESNFHEGNKRFAEVMVMGYRNLEPAIDYDIMFALNMLKNRNNGLSYYDKMLRSSLNIMPIVTDTDNAMYEESELLKHFTYLNLLSADCSVSQLKTITCFGTLEDCMSDTPVLQTTIESYRGCKLL